MTALVIGPMHPEAETGALQVELAGVRAKVTGDFPPVMEYARLHMAPLRIVAPGAPQIRARLFEGPPPDRMEAIPICAVGIASTATHAATARWRGSASRLPDLHLRFT